MNAESEMRTAPSISGHMIDLGEGHSIAIYVRAGVSYVAEFRDGRGEFTYAGAWFRAHNGGLRYCHNRRAALKSSTALTTEMLMNIERLHHESDAREERMLAAARGGAEAVQSSLLSLASWMRGLASKTRGTVG